MYGIAAQSRLIDNGQNAMVWSKESTKHVLVTSLGLPGRPINNITIGRRISKSVTDLLKLSMENEKK